MTLGAERTFLRPFFEQAAAGGLPVVSETARLEARLGRKAAQAGYKLPRRQGWRKVVPGKRQPRAGG